MKTDILSKIYDSYANGAIICTDTRTLGKDNIFFALKGENFNGNRFADEALHLGARWVIIDQGDWLTEKDDPRTIIVPDVLSALQQLATHHRRQLNIPVIAIGGSNGKTTTKELVAAVLSKKYKTLATTGNLNNHIGVPLTLLSIDRHHEIAIIEMGSNHPGEMEVLCKIAEPDHGLVTNIGKEHLEGFGNIEGVAREESYLYLYLKEKGGMCFVNADDPWLNNMSVRLNNKFSYGSGKGDLDVNTVLLDSFPGVKAGIAGTDIEISSQLPGAFNLENITAAIAVGVFFKVQLKDIKSAVENYVPGNKRSQIVNTESYTILLDCYNANPTSMEMALKSFARINLLPKAVILGDMLEMGEHSLHEHELITGLVNSLSFEEKFLVGPVFSTLAENCNAKGFLSWGDLKDYLLKNPIRSGQVLVKASRGISLEKALEHLIS